MALSDYINQQREKEKRDAIETSQNSLFYPLAAGLGAIALGSYVFSGKYKGGRNLLADMLHFLGKGQGVGLEKGLDSAARLPGSAVSGAGSRSLFSAQFNVAKKSLQLGPIDLINDLQHIIDTLGNTRGDIGNRIADRVTEWIHRRNIDIGPQSSFFGSDLQRVTAGQVLADSASWAEHIGSNQIETLYKARQYGLITDKTILDSGLYLNKANQVRDIRLSRIFSADGGIIGRLTGGLDIFGQRRVFDSLVGSKRGFAVLGPVGEQRGNRFFIGGNIFGYTGEGEEILLATNRKLRLTGDPLDAVYAARAGLLKADPEKIRAAYKSKNIPEALKDKLVDLETKYGVGIGFANRPSFIDRFIFNPIKRAQALLSGDGVVYRHQYVQGTLGTRIADAALGGEIPELALKQGRITKVPGGGTIVPIDSLNPLDRLAVLFDFKPGYSVIEASAAANRVNRGAIITNRDLIVPLPEGGLKSFYKPIFGKLGQLPGAEHARLTKVGDVINIPRPNFYDVDKSKVFPGLTSTKDFFNYMMYRLNSLASESLLGIGIAPGKTLLGTTLRVASLPLIYEAGRQAFEYIDYASEQVLGISPKKAIAGVYAKARVAQQKLREMTGIQQTLAWADDNFPGSINSEGSTLIRSIGLPLGIVGATFGGTKSKLGLGLAGLIYAAIGGPDPGQSSADLEAEYAGEKMVAVRRSRLWGMGYSPLFGGVVDHYDFNWNYKLQNDLEYKGLYGSKKEYFEYHQNVFGIPLPTPTNFLGIKNLANPYRWEDQHYLDRPYPSTGSPLSSFPIFGPLLGATVGRALKPTYNRISDLPLLNASLVDKGLEPSAARLLGIPERDASSIQINDPNNTLDMLRRQANIALEPAGIYKFVMQYYGVDLSDKGMPTLATSDIPTSPGREFYSKNLGGLFGQTELWRRFVLSDYYSQNSVSQLVNPIRNTMPCLLPDTEVLLEGNVCKRAEDIVVGDKVISKDGEIVEVEKIGKFPCDRIVHIELYGDNMHTSDFSPNHPLYMQDHTFMNAENVKPGDYVSFPIRKYTGNNNVIDLSNFISEAEFSISDKYIYYGIQKSNFIENEIAEQYRFDIKEIPLELKRDNPKLYEICRYRKTTNREESYKRFLRFWDVEDFYYLLGVYAAEGSAGNKGKSVKLAGHVNDKWEQNILDIFNKYGIKFSINDAHTGTGRYIVSSNPALLHILKTLCPGHAKDKHFSKETLNHNTSKAAIIKLIRGLIDGDGYYILTKDNRVRCGLRTVSKNLAYQFRCLIIDSLGIAPSITQAYKEDNLNIHITCSGLLANKLAEGIGYSPYVCSPRQNNDKQYSDSNFVYIKVRSVFIEEKKCYVIGHQVSGDHTFCTALIATHNTWMPGKYSSNMKDQGYFTDFTVGDPFIKVQNGEYRLPGKLYEETHKLYSDSPGVYSDVDKFLILADVAPYSNEYAQLERRVKNMKLPPYWANKVAEALSHRQEMIGPDTRYERYNEDVVTALNKGIKDNALYSMARKSYDTFTHDFLAEIPYVGSKLFPFRSPYEQYRKLQVEGAEFAGWDQPYENILRPMYYDVALSNPLTAALKGGVTAGLLYGPMRFFSPLKGLGGSLTSNVLYGAGIGSALSFERILSGKSSNYVPEHVQRESAAYEYMDKFSYLRARMYEEQAIQDGNKGLASQFANIRRKTMVGASSPIMAKASLPKSIDRRYFDYFMSRPGQERAQIMSGVPDYLANTMALVEGKDYPSKDQADADVLSYFSANPLPSADYIGWQPGISNSANRIKFIQHGINGISDNYHRHGFYESQLNEFKYRMPDLYNSSISFNSPVNFNSIKDLSSMYKGIRDTMFHRMAYTSSGVRNNIEVRRDSTYYSNDLLR